MGRDPKPTRSEAHRARMEAAAVGRIVSEVPVGLSMEGAATVSSAVAVALMPFLLRDDGWLRIVPQEDGATVYYKWKWTAGKHVNHYVMSVYPASQCAEALRRLATKVDAVDSGVEAPVKDHYFKG